MTEKESTEGFQISETENKIQQLYADLLGTTDEEKRHEIKKKIDSLKQTPEGQADQEKHNQVTRQNK